jgi:hypothetical protein
MASFMAAVREYVLKEPGESDEHYKERLYQIARPAFEQYMFRQREALRTTGQANASVGYRPGTEPEPYTMPVREERLHPKQTKLNRAKEKYSR